MGSKHSHWLILLLLLFLCTGCSSSSLKVYTIYEDHTDTAIVLYNDMLYEYNKNTDELSSAVKVADDMHTCANINTLSGDYSLIHTSLDKYTGTITDATAYYNKLVMEGFEVSNLDYKHNYLDVLLCRDEESIRILYLGGEVVRIFYENTKNNNYFPPYIIEKGIE